MSEMITVFVLAAGRGERLRPISDYIPKPLMPLLGKTVMERVLEKISVLKHDGIGINLHYKREILENWVRSSAYAKGISLFPEEPVLGTGGALKNAEEFLRYRTFLVHNSDILTDIDLQELVDSHLRSDNIATLAIHDFSKFNILCIDGAGAFKMIGSENCTATRTLTRVAFTGIAVYSPEFLQFISEGVSSVVEAWEKAVNAGFKIGTFDVTGCHWSDIGDPISYASSVFRMLKNDGEKIYVHPLSQGCSSAEYDGYIVLEENSDIGESVYLRNCIVLPGSGVQKGSHVENCIVGCGFQVALREGEILGFSEKTGMIQVGTGGSDRAYYRVKEGQNSAVLMKCGVNDPDFYRHIEYSKFFKQSYIPVPKLISVHRKKKEALFEDLGDLSLYNWLRCNRGENTIVEKYHLVMDIAVLIHTITAERIAGCPLIMERIFDYDHFLWETRYFIDSFVHGLKRAEIKDIGGLLEEFREIALKADMHQKTVIHRDFQSQNIMIKRTGDPCVIDFQGARIGPPAYDVASVLWDPYVRLDDHIRERLLTYYKDRMINIAGENFNPTHFDDALIVCRLQRHMQALGAYGFLSNVKGKNYFLKFVPQALALLREDLYHTGENYPKLKELVNKLR